MWNQPGAALALIALPAFFSADAKDIFGLALQT